MASYHPLSPTDEEQTAPEDLPEFTPVHSSGYDYKQFVDLPEFTPLGLTETSEAVGEGLVQEDVKRPEVVVVAEVSVAQLEEEKSTIRTETVVTQSQELDQSSKKPKKPKGSKKPKEKKAKEFPKEEVVPVAEFTEVYEETGSEVTGSQQSPAPVTLLAAQPEAVEVIEDSSAIEYRAEIEVAAEGPGDLPSDPIVVISDVPSVQPEEAKSTTRIEPAAIKSQEVDNSSKKQRKSKGSKKPKGKRAKEKVAQVAEVYEETGSEVTGSQQNSAPHLAAEPETVEVIEESSAIEYRAEIDVAAEGPGGDSPDPRIEELESRIREIHRKQKIVQLDTVKQQKSVSEKKQKQSKLGKQLQQTQQTVEKLKEEISKTKFPEAVPKDELRLKQLKARLHILSEDLFAKETEYAKYRVFHENKSKETIGMKEKTANLQAEKKKLDEDHFSAVSETDEYMSEIRRLEELIRQANAEIESTKSSLPSKNYEGTLKDLQQVHSTQLKSLSERESLAHSTVIRLEQDKSQYLTSDLDFPEPKPESRPGKTRGKLSTQIEEKTAELKTKNAALRQLREALEATEQGCCFSFLLFIIGMCLGLLLMRFLIAVD